MPFKCLLVLALFILFPSSLFAQPWEPKQAPLMTRFSDEVNPNNVLPEYPRPQMVRDKWLNLNGVWQFQVGTGNTGEPPQNGWGRSILVPFAVESALSGIMEQHQHVLYRRTFTLPVDWSGERVLLHFGAVDYEAVVFVNGEKIGTHKGGYDPFSFDITSALSGSGEQEIVVRVYDPTDNGGYPRGKQSLNPGGIMYTSVTGIWQTVWLEPVPQTRIDNIKIVPDIDHSEISLTVNTAGLADNLSIKAAIKDGNAIGQDGTGSVNTELTIPVPGQKLWSPENPFLYDLDITLMRDGTPIDSVSSYFGMRKIAVKEINGQKKLFLNNEFLFQIGQLDQGYWPDGIYTAPTDEALKYDLEVAKQLGYNMVRKHLKVEPRRWYYWADKLGLLVWQDMPSANSYTENTPPVEREAFESELKRMVKTHWNSPSIIMWVVFNES